MLVYRIENAQGFGPYRQEPYHNDMVSNFNPHSVNMWDFERQQPRPIPRNDGIENMQEDEFCGFSSLDDLIQWFDSLIPQLEFYDYCVSIYKVKKRFVRFGKRQVVFQRAKALLVERLTPQIGELCC